MTRAVVLSAVRTPVGRYGGGLAGRPVHGYDGAGDHLYLTPAGLNDCVHNRHLCKGNSVQPKGFTCKELQPLG